MAMDDFALNDNVVIVKLLLDAGANVYNSDVLKNTIQNEHVDVVEVLL